MPFVNRVTVSVVNSSLVDPFSTFHHHPSNSCWDVCHIVPLQIHSRSFSTCPADALRHLPSPALQYLTGTFPLTSNQTVEVSKLLLASVFWNLESESCYLPVLNPCLFFFFFFWTLDLFACWDFQVLTLACFNDSISFCTFIWLLNTWTVPVCLVDGFPKSQRFQLAGGAA